MGRGGLVLMNREKLIQLRWLLLEWQKEMESMGFGKDNIIKIQVEAIDIRIKVLETTE